MTTDPIVVQALFSFKGSNNDELCFRKGDVITITQKDDGGWWEGTLGDVTGWFPVNYVREIKDPSLLQQLTTSLQPDIQNLSIVYKDLLESERAHVTELQGLLNNFLIPLEKSTILSTDEYKQLTGNFIEVLEAHQELLRLIENENQKPHHEQRIGKVFLNYAPRMKAGHQVYRSLHPKAVCIIDKYREELMKYMESCGANCPGVLVLTTGLGKPFRRLAKYSRMLLEVERHVEDCHPDRGDIQRSVAMYKEMEASCEATRRQKEIELQIITGPVRGWEGQSLATLGDIIYMGSVAVGPQHLDRYLILFPSTLLILSLSHRLSGFIYEGKLPVTGINVVKLEDSDQYKNGFEISGPMIEKFVAVCQSREEANHWVEILGKSNPNRTNSITNKALPSRVEIVPQPPPHKTRFVATTNGNPRLGGKISSDTRSFNSGWSINCLRPSQPFRPCTSLLSNRQNGKSFSYKDDALILEVVEAYFSAKSRNTVNSVELLTGGNVKMHAWLDKTQRCCSSGGDFGGTSSSAGPPVYSHLLHPPDYVPADGNFRKSHNNANEQLIRLQQKIKNIESNMELLSTQLTEERAARCVLQTIVKKHLSSKELDSVEWPTMESNIMS